MLSCKKGTGGGVKIWVSVHLSLVLKPFAHIFAQLPEMGWDLTSQQRFQTSWNLRKMCRNLAVNVKKYFIQIRRKFYSILVFIKPLFRDK